MPTTGTATGIYRTGLAKAGLVSVETLGDAQLRIGRVGIAGGAAARYDLRVELLSNGVSVASGLERCLAIAKFGTTDVAVPWDAFDAPEVEAGDVLALRVSARVGTNPDDSACGSQGRHGALRLLYGSTAHPSHFEAEITPSPSVALYLLPAASLAEGAPTAAVGGFQDSADLKFKDGNPWSEIGTWSLDPQAGCEDAYIQEVETSPPAPAPETIVVERLPLPPPPPGGAGSCDLATHPGGCISSVGQVGGFIDATHLVTNVTYAGAPAGSSFTGTRLIIVKTDGTTFSNGTPWKCVTCGTAIGGASHPEPFNDGKRIFLEADDILECDEPLISDACTAANIHRYPIRWNKTGNPSGPGGSIRESRIHPDDVHFGWNHTITSNVTRFDQFVFYGRLVFNPGPATGTPAAPRYDLENVSMLYNANRPKTIGEDPDHPGELEVDFFSQELGEFRGWTKDGKWAVSIQYPTESSNIDIYMTSMETGEVRRWTREPDYCDPMGISPDSQWGVCMDTRAHDRMKFFSGMRGIPPLTDLLTTGVVSAVRNRGDGRRFFQSYLIDIHGDRGDYEGQRLAECNGTPGRDGTPGDLCDLDWNDFADPLWSKDGKTIAWLQIAASEAVSLEPGGRRNRVLLARFPDREPTAYTPPPVAPDEVPWATPWIPGSTPDPVRVTNVPPVGTFTLKGQVHGSATVTLDVTTTAGPTPVPRFVAADYDDYSDDGIHVINGTESVERLPTTTLTTRNQVWHSDLTASGCQEGTKVTSEPDGFRPMINILGNGFNGTGTLTTTVDGNVYTNPANGQ